MACRCQFNVAVDNAVVAGRPDSTWQEVRLVELGSTWQWTTGGSWSVCVSIGLVDVAVGSWQLVDRWSNAHVVWIIGVRVLFLQRVQGDGWGG